MKTRVRLAIRYYQAMMRARPWGGPIWRRWNRRLHEQLQYLNEREREPYYRAILKWRTAHAQRRRRADA